MPSTGVTPRALMDRALRLANAIGEGQTPSAAQYSDLFAELQMMLAEWQTDRFLVYQDVEIVCPSTNAEWYTIGPGQQFNVARPMRLEQAFARQNPGGSPTPVDYPLEMLFSREDYARIRLKSLSSWPQTIYYDRGFPIGNIAIWPIPNTSFEIHLVLMQQLQQFETQYDTISMPPIYQRAIQYNLAIIAGAMNGLPPDGVVVAIAKKSLSRLRGSNAEIPRLVTGDEGGSTNIYDPYNAGAN